MHVGRAYQHAHLARLVIVVLAISVVKKGEVVIIGHIGGGQKAAHVVAKSAGSPDRNSPSLAYTTRFWVRGKLENATRIPASRKPRSTASTSLLQGSDGALRVVVHHGGGAGRHHVQGGVQG